MSLTRQQLVEMLSECLVRAAFNDLLRAESEGGDPEPEEKQSPPDPMTLDTRGAA